MSVSAAWTLQPNVPLQRFNTFGLDVTAPWLLDLYDARSLPAALAHAQSKGLPLLPLGSGSNVLFVGDPQACIVRLHSRHADILACDDGHALIRVGAGFDWHAWVMWSLAHGFAGLENLALIPGSVGACAVQNIGAYGTQVDTLIDCVETYDCHRAEFFNFSVKDCDFGYRDSLFKRHPDRYLIIAVRFRLPRSQPPRLDYPGISAELQRHRISQPSPLDVAHAVIRLRSRKLPDPKILGNVGSFFKNPVILLSEYDTLHQRLPQLPCYPMAAQAAVKVPAAGLIEACGWKGYRNGDAGVYPHHALVLVNYGQATGSELLQLAQAISTDVSRQLGVTLEPEPRLIGASW